MFNGLGWKLFTIPLSVYPNQLYLFVSSAAEAIQQFNSNIQRPSAEIECHLICKCFIGGKLQLFVYGN